MDVDAPTVIPPSIVPPVPKPYRPFDTPKGPVKYLALREDLTPEEFEKLNTLTDKLVKDERDKLYEEAWLYADAEGKTMDEKTELRRKYYEKFVEEVFPNARYTATINLGYGKPPEKASALATAPPPEPPKTKKYKVFLPEMKNTEEQLAWINTKDAELTKAQKKEIIEKYMRKKNAEIKALKGNKKRAELVKEIKQRYMKGGTFEFNL